MLLRISPFANEDDIAFVQEKPATPKPIAQVKLKLIGRDQFEIAVINQSGQPLIFSDFECFTVVYHQALNGTRTALTRDGSGTDAPLIGPFDTIRLGPTATYRFTRRVLVDIEHNLDYRLYLNKPGALVAVVKPLRAGNIDRRFYSEIRAPILKSKLESNHVVILPRS
ncbi:MAG TPA: hypothetical protein PKY51_11895 [Fimbriimonadaceae bacterium]|nr:hypothetical protein [Fimbriimonadaceae bacterium]